jgi:long-chain acyl-CoA synthetase
MENCAEYAVIMFAVWHAGLVVVPMNAKLHAREFEHILGDSEASLCITSDKCIDAVRSALNDLPALQQVLNVDAGDMATLYEGNGMPLESRRASDLAWLFYTSGTTGLPKGAMQSHANLYALTRCYLADVDTIGPGEAVLHAAPMSHGGGYYMLPHVARGGVQVVPRSGGFDVPEVLELIQAYPGMSMFAAPTMVKRLVEHPLSQDADFANLKTIVYGGGPMYQEDLRKAMALLGNKLAQIYGQGESPMTITSLSKYLHADRLHPRYRERLASVGVAQTAIEVLVVDDASAPQPPGVPGEIVVRGDSVMLGYWRNDAATAKTLRDGWLYTGDVGVFDEDGFLTLTDRSKDVVISGGTNIYPREVEEILLQHAGVLEVSVIGQRDADWGEIVVAVVVPEQGHGIDSKGLDAWCCEHMARFKRPKKYLFLDALPKNSTGKILKTKLRELLQSTD